MAIELSEEKILPYLWKAEPLSTSVTVACINSPSNVTVSGDEAAIDALKVLLDADKIWTRKLAVGLAYHSKQMTEIAEQYSRSIQGLETRLSVMSSPFMISSVTGNKVSANELRQSEYWVKNMVSPVRFSDTMIKLISQTANLRKKVGATRKEAVLVHELLEIGPHAALQGPIKTILETFGSGKKIGYGSLLIRHMSALKTTLDTAGRLHCLGYPILLQEVNQTSSKADSLMSLQNLPEYPFDHSQRYWYESRISEGLRLRKHPHLDLLGTPVADWNPLEARWRKIIRMTETPWVEDHKVLGMMGYLRLR